MKKFLIKTIIFILVALLCIPSFASVADDAKADTYEAMEHKVIIAPGEISPEAPLGANRPWAISETGATQFKNQGSVSKANGAVYRLELPEIDSGKTLGKYVFRFTTRQYSGSDMMISHMEGIDENEIPSLKASDSRIAARAASPDEYNILDSTIVDDMQNIWRFNYADLTTYAKKCMDMGQKYFYVYVNCRWTTNIIGVTDDSAYVADKLYPMYFYDTTDADVLRLVSSDPSNGEENSRTQYATLRFTNPLSNAEAVINGESAECEITAAEVRVLSELLPFNDYVLTLKATDIYAQEHSVTVYFSTGGENGTMIEGERSGVAYHITKSAVPAEMKTRKSVRYASSYMVFFRIPIPEISANGEISKYVLNYTTYGADNDVSVLKFAGDNWDVGSMKFTDDNVSAILTDWNTNGDNSAYNASASRSVTPHSEEKYFRCSEDITSYVKECMANGEEYIDIGLISDLVVQVFGFFATSEDYADYQASCDYMEPINEMRTADAVVSINGTLLQKASFSICTDIENIEEKAELRTADGNKAEAEFEYDESKRTLSLVGEAKLSAGEEYFIVLPAGTEDLYGNVCEEDYVVIRFVSGDDIYVANPKLVDASDESDYDSATALTSANDASEVKMMTKISNNTSDDLEVMLIIASYDADGNLCDMAINIANVESGVQDEELEAASVEADDSIKAFVWQTESRKVLSEKAEI